jgi:hypothetical protein
MTRNDETHEQRIIRLERIFHEYHAANLAHPVIDHCIAYEDIETDRFVNIAIRDLDESGNHVKRVQHSTVDQIPYGIALFSAKKGQPVDVLIAGATEPFVTITWPADPNNGKS